MKATNPRILRDTVLWMPLLALGAALWAGPWFGAEVVFTALLAIANLALYRWLTGTVLTRLAAREEPGLAGVLLATKLFFTAGLLFVLMAVVSVESIAIGLMTPLLGVATTGLRLALMSSHAAPSPVLES